MPTGKRTAVTPGSSSLLNDAHVAWLRELPVAARIGPALLIHSDAALHRRWDPRSRVRMPRCARRWQGRTRCSWDHLLATFSGRRAFLDTSVAAELLAAWGGREVVHGHTPLGKLFGEPRAARSGAVRYADGRAVAVDGGTYAGNEVIIHRVPRDPD